MEDPSKWWQESLHPEWDVQRRYGLSWMYAALCWFSGATIELDTVGEDFDKRLKDTLDAIRGDGRKVAMNASPRSFSLLRAIAGCVDARADPAICCMRNSSRARFCVSPCGEIVVRRRRAPARTPSPSGLRLRLYTARARRSNFYELLRP